MIKWFVVFWKLIRKLLPRRSYVAIICHHNTKREGEIAAFDRKIWMKMPLNKDGGVDYCLSCIAAMTIRCAWCKEPIFIGDPVTLSLPIDKNLIQKGAVIYDGLYVGCLRQDCTDSGSNGSGFLLPGPDGKGRIVCQ